MDTNLLNTIVQFHPGKYFVVSRRDPYQALFTFLFTEKNLALVYQKLLPFIFAHETNIFIQLKYIPRLQNDMNKEMKIRVFLKGTKLSLNIYRTHFILCNGKQKSWWSLNRFW